MSEFSFSQILPALPEMYLAAAACVLLVFDLFFAEKAPGRTATLPAASNSAQALAAGANYQATLANYQQQLLTAYIAGNSFDSTTDGGDTGKIA